jgi:hypothetical protein
MAVSICINNYNIRLMKKPGIPGIVYAVINNAKEIPFKLEENKVYPPPPEEAGLDAKTMANLTRRVEQYYTSA